MIRQILFDISRYVYNNLPIQYRLSKFALFVKSLLYPVAYNYMVFTDYGFSNLALSHYSSAVTYGEGDRVVYKFAEYISLQGSNTGNDPETVISYWAKINDIFIGVNERVKYNGRKLTFEWALNRYFNTTFRQPDHVGTPTNSDIYISNIARAGRSFVMYPDWYRSSVMYPTTSAPRYMLVSPVYTAPSAYEYNINIPLAVFNALGSSDPIRESIVRNFADRYNEVGLTYYVVTY